MSPSSCIVGFMPLLPQALSVFPPSFMMNLLQGRWCTQTSLTSPLTPFSTTPVLSICAQQSLETRSPKVPGRTISPQISLLLTSMQREAGGKEISPMAHPSGEPVESANEQMLKNCKKDTAPKERRGAQTQNELCTAGKVAEAAQTPIPTSFLLPVINSCSLILVVSVPQQIMQSPFQ